MKEIWRRLRGLRAKREFDSELDDEMRFHVESRAAELESQGMSRQDATARARREFGSTLRLGEDTRAAWRFQWIEDLLADLRYAARGLRRNPALAGVAILSLALGIGLNTAIFSFTMEFLFSEPAVRDAASLVRARIGGNSHAPMREFRFIRQSAPFAAVAGMREEAEVNWRSGEETARLSVFQVSDNFFDVLGVPVAKGRPIHAGDRDAIVIGHWFWQRRLGGMDHAIGRALVLDGRPHTVVGILPPNHRTVIGFGLAPQLYMIAPETTDLAIFGRLGPGTSRAEAQARLTAAAAELDRVYPSEHLKWAHNIQVDGITSFARYHSIAKAMPFLIFFGLVMTMAGLVLLVACANVAGLLLARAASRGQEIAVRMAIGAGRWRVARQFLAESLLLAGLGTAAGLALNVWVTRFVEKIEINAVIPIRLVVEPDWRLALYAACVALVSALVSGVMPALNAARHDVQTALKHGERQVAGRTRIRRLLVAGQIAVSVFLLSTGFLFLRNLLQAGSQSPGFDVSRTLWARVRLVGEHYPTPESKRAISDAALEAMRSLPGVVSAALVEVVPLNDNQTSGGELAVEGGEKMRVRFNSNSVGSDYFRTMGIPILAGREFTDADVAGGLPMVVMNQTMARSVFGETNPVGRFVELHGDRIAVIGVAADSKYFTLGERSSSALYRAITPRVRRDTLNLILRCVPPPEGLVKPAVAALATLDRSAAIEAKPMSQALGFALLPSQVGAALLGSIGLLGLLLASVGLYGLMAYSVARRLREVGLRIALGATPRDIFQLVGREAFALLAAGITVGMAIAWFAASPLAMFLVPGMSPVDPVSFGGVVITLAIVGLVATLGPARKAIRVDPMQALRWE